MSFRFGWGRAVPPNGGGHGCRVAPLIRPARRSFLASLASLCAHSDTALVPGATSGGATNRRDTHGSSTQAAQERRRPGGSGSCTRRCSQHPRRRHRGLSQRIQGSHLNRLVESGSDSRRISRPDPSSQSEYPKHRRGRLTIPTGSWTPKTPECMRRGQRLVCPRRIRVIAR